LVYLLSSSFADLLNGALVVLENFFTAWYTEWLLYWSPEWPFHRILEWLTSWSNM
jgi:hypothetical protein